MRKTLTQALLAAFCAILVRGTFAADMGGGGMIAAAHHSMIAARAKTPTAKDYVQTGLVAMCDGIENAGWGTHDAAATRWVDLTGNIQLTHPSTPQWLDNAMVLDGNHNHAPSGSSSALMSAINSDDVSVEIVFRPEDGTAYGNNAMFGFGSSNGNERGLWFWGNLRATYRGINNNITSSTTIDNNSDNAFSFGSNGVYKNGQFAASITKGTATMAKSFFNIGRIPAFYSSVNEYTAIKGRCYAVRFYSRALAASEIAANYAIDKARFGLT